MLKINKDERSLASLQQLKLSPTSVSEDFDSRELILNSPDAFFDEIGNSLFVIGRNISLSEETQIQCDLLGLDRSGQAVVLVIDRSDEKSQLVRGITCAGLIAGWRQDDFLRRLSDEQIRELGSFLSVDVTAINQQQRVIFVADNYGFEALTAMNWLRNRGIDVLAVQVSRANGFTTDGEYFWCTSISDEENLSQPLVMEEGASGFEVRLGLASDAARISPEDLAAEVDARKRAEQALRASEERYWTLAKLSPVGIFHTDAEGNLLYVNDRWCEMAGLTQEEAQGQGWARGLHSDDRDRVLNDWQETTEQGLPFKAEFRFQRPDGGTSWVLGEAAVQQDENDKLTGYVGTITELHRVDATTGGGSVAAGGV